MHAESGDRFEKNTAQERSKKPYATPRLSDHGTVEEITRGTAPGSADAVAPGSPAL